MTKHQNLGEKGFLAGLETLYSITQKLNDIPADKNESQHPSTLFFTPQKCNYKSIHKHLEFSIHIYLKKALFLNTIECYNKNVLYKENIEHYLEYLYIISILY